MYHPGFLTTPSHLGHSKTNGNLVINNLQQKDNL